MAPASMTTRATTIVLELQSNTPLFATVRINEANTGHTEIINPLRTRDPVMYVNTVSTGRRTATSDYGIARLELHFWRRQRDDDEQCSRTCRSTDHSSPDMTLDVALPSWWKDQMYLRAMEVSIQNTESISFVPATLLSPAYGYNTVNCVQCLFHLTNDNERFEKMMFGLPRNLEGADDTVA
jgi:hypothetical protein